MLLGGAKTMTLWEWLKVTVQNWFEHRATNRTWDAQLSLK